MNVREYVDDLFAQYQDSDDMADFKEEVCGNLQARMDYLEKKGLTQEEAFQKAAAELGDISEIADQISNEKRKEVIGTMYMKTRSYMDKWHVIGYTAAGGLLGLGIILALLAYFSSYNPTALAGSLLVFFIAPVCGFVFLGLTQETATNYPMHWLWALFYTAAVGVILFGLIVFAIVFLSADREINAALGSLIPFVLPGAVVLCFLLLTEKSRHKPWVVEQETLWAERTKEQFADPHTATRFGLYTGALWILAIALFITLGFIIGFRYSWLVFLFVIALQLLIQALMIPRKK